MTAQERINELELNMDRLLDAMERMQKDLDTLHNGMQQVINVIRIQSSRLDRIDPLMGLRSLP